MINEKPQSKLDSSFTDMPLKDRIFLSPIEKYKIYGRFPWKMIIHIFLVIATTAQAMLTISDTTQYTRAQERLLYNYFISDSDKTSLDFSRKAYLYSINDLKNRVNTSVSNFYSVKSNSLERVEYTSKNIEELFINAKFSYFDVKDKYKEPLSDIPKKYVFKINEQNIYPFDQSEYNLKKFLNSVTDFSLNFTLITYVPFFYGDHYECFIWKIDQLFNFSHRAHFVTSLIINRNSCKDETNMNIFEIFINRLLWLHIVVIILAFISLILTWRYVYKIAKLYWRLKRKIKEKRNKEEKDILNDQDGIESKNREAQLEFKNSEEEELNKKKSSNKEPDFFNMWSLLCLAGNIIQIFGSVMSLLDNNNIMSITEILVGFGCMLAYINVGRYLEYNRDYSTIFATIKRAMPNVFRYLLGVMPIFLGFIFFGLCLFWRSERFVSTSSTMMTLFAMLNGDSVFDIFHDLSGVSFFIGQAYCYSFCIIFIVVVMNVFISIIEEAYVSTKMQNQNHWIYSYLKIDPNYVHIKDIDDSKNEGKRGDSLMDHSKQRNKLLQSLNSKNILREAISFKEDDIIKKENKKAKDLTKQDVEKMIENHFSNIEKSLNEVENISKEVASTKDTVMKDEMRLLITDHITVLESKVSNLRDVWFQQI